MLIYFLETIIWKMVQFHLYETWVIIIILKINSEFHTKFYFISDLTLLENNGVISLMAMKIIIGYWKF